MEARVWKLLYIDIYTCPPVCVCATYINEDAWTGKKLARKVIIRTEHSRTCAEYLFRARVYRLFDVHSSLSMDWPTSSAPRIYQQISD